MRSIKRNGENNGAHGGIAAWHEKHRRASASIGGVSAAGGKITYQRAALARRANIIGMVNNVAAA